MYATLLQARPLPDQDIPTLTQLQLQPYLVMQRYLVTKPKYYPQIYPLAVP